MLHMNLSQIIGVDEVGRGPLAGPVVAVALILEIPAHYIKDSKKLSKPRIQYVSKILKSSCIYAIGEASVSEIEEYNILNATMLAMRRAILQIPDYSTKKILIDGNQNPFKCSELSVETIIKGDEKIETISAASIVAKEYRDSLMSRLSDDYPKYGWDKNSGYGTTKHINAIMEYGITEHHRKKFCKNIKVNSI